MIDTASSYIGSNYQSGGKNPDTGFDCSGFTSFVFRKNGIDISGPSHDLAKLGKSKNKNELAPGDLVFSEALKEFPMLLLCLLSIIIPLK
ncbi:MAG: C40 family peptidase [Saprospiraceae bacterium]|nr:C40 family peptidase [Saprospiraceae bacterium]